MNWLDTFTQWTAQLAGYAWGIPSIILLVGTGLYLTIRLGLIQMRGFGHAIALVSGKYSDKRAKGETTPFQALCTSLSATIGTGNIAGVATAIVLGGPGALFWMWLTALVGMATRFSTATLALKFRQISPEGEISGGPMYTIKYGLKRPVLAGCYAAFTLIASFGIGNMVQANSIVDGLGYMIPQSESLDVLIGVILAVMVGLVILGGVKRIAHVASIIVPFMAVFYVAAALCVIIANIDQVPHALWTIVNLALNPAAVGGGAIGSAIQYGVARGVFSNEAGLGAATIAHATAKTDQPVRQGLVAMLGPFIDTLLICTMTGLVIVISGAWQNPAASDLTGASLSAFAFDSGLSQFHITALGGWIVSIGLIFFAFTTMLSWSYYGDRCAQFLFGERAVLPYRLIFTLVIIVGASFPLHLVWNLADIANILMALPNLISLILLAGVVRSMSKSYFDELKLHS